MFDDPGNQEGSYANRTAVKGSTELQLNSVLMSADPILSGVRRGAPCWYLCYSACDDGHTAHDECSAARHVVYSAALYTQSQLNANEVQQLREPGPPTSDEIGAVVIDRTRSNNDLAVALPRYEHKCFQNHV